MVGDGRSRIETTRKPENTPRISEKSRNSHQMFPRALGWLAVKFPVWKQNYRANILFQSRLDVVKSHLTYTHHYLANSRRTCELHLHIVLVRVAYPFHRIHIISAIPRWCGNLMKLSSGSAAGSAVCCELTDSYQRIVWWAIFKSNQIQLRPQTMNIQWLNGTICAVT